MTPEYIRHLERRAVAQDEMLARADTRILALLRDAERAAEREQSLIDRVRALEAMLSKAHKN